MKKNIQGQKRGNGRQGCAACATSKHRPHIVATLLSSTVQECTKRLNTRPISCNRIFEGKKTKKRISYLYKWRSDNQNRWECAADGILALTRGSTSSLFRRKNPNTPRSALRRPLSALPPLPPMSPSAENGTAKNLF